MSVMAGGLVGFMELLQFARDVELSRDVVGGHGTLNGVRPTLGYACRERRVAAPATGGAVQVVEAGFRNSPWS